jgi:WD40 repeat protein
MNQQWVNAMEKFSFEEDVYSPFKFLDAYGREDKDIFFGRDEEIELLYDTTFKTDLVLLYGQSGTGKTSLIRCGLANKFRESEWLNLTIRRGDNINSSLWREIDRYSRIPVELETTIAEAIESLYTDFLRPVYLIFDQFEELFILGSKTEQEAFFKKVSFLLQSGVPCKLVFVMREEYIAYLHNFEKLVPGLFRNRIRIEPMYITEVEKVIRGSAAAFDIPLDKDNPDETVKKIIENISDEKAGIPLPYLQVYLDRLYREAVKSEKNSKTGFTLELVRKTGAISDVLGDFLDRQTQQIQLALNGKYPAAPSEAVWQVLNRFVTAEGTGLSIPTGKLYDTLPFDRDIISLCLEGLEKSRILRPADEGKTYELAHDTLARRIDDKRSVEEKTLVKIEKLVKDRFSAYKDTSTLLSKGELNYIEPYEKKLKSKLDTDEIKFIKKSRQKVSKRRKLIAYTTAAIILILLLFALFSIWQWKIAERNYKSAEASRLVVIAEGIAKQNPTVALRIAETAWQLNKNKIVTETIHKIYRENRFYKIIVKQDNYIEVAAFSPDSKYILTGSEDGIARLWDLQGNLLQDFTGHEMRITCAAFSPDGEYVLTGSEDKTARLWHLKGSELRAFRGHEEWVHSAAFSPDGQSILTGSRDKTARLWDWQGNILQVFAGHNGDMLSVAFSPDGKSILTGSTDETACLWDLQGNKLQDFRGHEKWVNSVAFSRDGKHILTGSEDKTARLWDLEGKELKVFEGHTHNVLSATFSPDGKHILTGSGDGTSRLWDLRGNQLQVLRGHENWVTSAAFSSDSKYILTGSKDKTARLWKLQGKTFSRHKRLVTSVAYSPDGKCILTGSRDDTARLWDLEGKELQVFEGHTDNVLSAVFSPDSNHILTGSQDGTSRLWDLQGKVLQVFRGHKDCVVSAVFSPDGKYILTGSWDDTARLWNLQGEVLLVLNKHKDDVTCAAFSPDGKYILTGSWDDTARLWDFKGNIIHTYKSDKNLISALAFSPDGKYIFTGSEHGSSQLWDLKGGKIQEFTGPEQGVSSAAFSPDGKYILTGVLDKTTRLWNLEGEELQVFKGHEHGVTSVAFSPHGKYILTGSKDKTVRIWELVPLEDFLKNGVCEKLNHEQRIKYGIPPPGKGEKKKEEIK